MNAIYPTRRAVAAVALGMPVALLLALATPGLWFVGTAWSVAVLILLAVDTGLGMRNLRLTVDADLPETLGVGRSVLARFVISFPSAAPPSLEVELEGNGRLSIAPRRQMLPVEGPVASARFQLDPLRRGEGLLENVWLRWTGPLGLAHIQHKHRMGRKLSIIPDIESVRAEALRLFQRDTEAGLQPQLDRGQGAEFHALRDFQSGHDPRQIDWKQSARHNGLLVKEFRLEQNQHIVAALDTGRLMGDELLGQPRLDRALHAILLLAYVALKLGDKVGLYAFDAGPRLRSGSVSGVRAFPALQRLAASLDYSTAETNFTLGLTQLFRDLERRSIVILFSDFADTTSAELMLENIARLVKRHMVLFVLFRDEELEAMEQEPPLRAQDATCAVVAHQLLREREIVLGRLRQMGVNVIDVPVDRIASGVLSEYMAVKQRSRWQA